MKAIAKKLAADEGHRQPKQRHYAAILGVSQPQVSAWFGGKGLPSAESLLKLATRAQDRDDRLWLLEQAGVNLGVVAADVVGRAPARNNSQAAQPQITIPIFESEDFKAHGRNFVGDQGLVSIPASLFSESESIVGVRTVRREPFVMPSGELVLIDTSKRNSRDGLGQKVAVFFETFPTEDDSYRWRTTLVHRHRSLRPPTPKLDVKKARLTEEFHRRRDPEGFAKNEAASDELWRRVLEEAQRPGFITGAIQVQYASDEANAEWRPDGDPWCLILRPDQARGYLTPEIMLTQWQTSADPYDAVIDLQEILREGVRIMGRVVGRIAAPASLSAGQRDEASPSLPEGTSAPSRPVEPRAREKKRKAAVKPEGAGTT